MKLRTDGWYGRPLEGFGYRSWMTRCLSDDAFTAGKPHIFPPHHEGRRNFGLQQCCCAIFGHGYRRVVAG